MAWIVRNIELNKLEWASLVDKGASGDAKNRPRIVLWKRSQSAIGKLKKFLGIKKETKKEVCKMDPTLDLALDQLGLDDKQKEAVLAMLSAAKGTPIKPEEPKAPEAPKPEDKKEGEPMPAELKKRLDEEEAKRVDLEKRLKVAEEKAQTIELEKMADAFPFVPAKRDEIVSILKRAEDNKDNTIVELLKKVNEAMKNSPAFKEHGKNSTNDGSDANSKLIAIAKRNQEKFSGMKLAEAFALAAKENPDLYTEAREGTK